MDKSCLVPSHQSAHLIDLLCTGQRSLCVHLFLIVDQSELPVKHPYNKGAQCEGFPAACDISSTPSSDHAQYYLIPVMMLEPVISIWCGHWQHGEMPTACDVPKQSHTQVLIPSKFTDD